MIDLRRLVFGWVLRHGYLGLSSLLMLGIVGLPVPDETLLVFAGYLVYRGDLGLLPTILAGFAGAAIGITLSYGIGRSLGHRLIVRYGSFFHLTPERMDRVSAWYAHGGNWSLTVGYFVPGFRHVVALIAGASEVPFRSLALFAYPGALAWVATFVAIGKIFGREWEWMADQIHMHLVIAAVVLGVVIAIFWFMRRKNRTGF